MLSFEINAPYNQNLELHSVPINNLQPKTKPISYHGVINQSFQVRIAQERLGLAQYNERNADSSEGHLKEQYEFNRKMVEEEITLLQKGNT